jgi:uncharacterized membrane protein
MKHLGLCFSGDGTRLKRNQNRNFLEKKIKRTQKGAKSTSHSNEEKTIILTILVALLIMAAILVYVVFTPVQKEPFTSLYLLDSEKQLGNIPKTVVLSENSTFTLWVGVENQNDTTIDYSVQVKLDDGNSTEDSSSAELIECFNRTLVNGKTWESPVTISIEKIGNNTVIFELWFFNETENDWNQTKSWLNLSIEAVEAK